MSNDPKSGSLSPAAATTETLETGIHHLHQALPITFLKAFFGGLLLSAGGLLSLSISGGDPDLAPGIEHLLLGLTFPVGLVIIYFVGGDLYTGYPMWFTLAALEKKGTPWLYASRAATSWLGDLAGSLFFAYFFTYHTRLLSDEPFETGVVEMITTDIVDLEWHVIFLRAIPCGFLVTMAMFLGTQNHDGISKALGLHLPFFLSVAARFPHTVEYMYLTSVGILLGAPLSWGAYFWKALLPITLGNTVGGSVLTGTYAWLVFMEGERSAWGQQVENGHPATGSLRLG